MILHVNNPVPHKLSMYALLTVICLAILPLGCGRPPQVDPLRPEEYGVYKVIVDSLCGFTATIIIPGPTRAEVNFIGDSTLTTSDITRYGGCFDSCRVGHGPLFWLLPRGDKSHTDCVPFHEVFPYLRQHKPQYNWSEIQRDFDSINAASTLLDSAKFTFDIPTHFVPSSKVRRIHVPFKSCLRLRIQPSTRLLHKQRPGRRGICISFEAGKFLAHRILASAVLVELGNAAA